MTRLIDASDFADGHFMVADGYFKEGSKIRLWVDNTNNCFPCVLKGIAGWANTYEAQAHNGFWLKSNVVIGKRSLTFLPGAAASAASERSSTAGKSATSTTTSASSSKAARPTTPSGT